MASRLGESTNREPPNPDAGHFEYNICFDLVQDPIVTRCGHLFYWPCLRTNDYRYRTHHNNTIDYTILTQLAWPHSVAQLYHLNPIAFIMPSSTQICVGRCSKHCVQRRTELLCFAAAREDELRPSR
ncbi:unnamed protein product [Fraxinus pennsylvanica]|uniref:E3 ubiquitin-protein ligase RMA n=1 Tax=Fraxinus pennsylvanica TaxID=56036 RepID=A0AAD2DGV0_9LAMI|nr:unnamed protein product [Fraxinus pennsylvanica]